MSSVGFQGASSVMTPQGPPAGGGTALFGLHPGAPRPFRLTEKTFGARTTLAVNVHPTTVFTIQPIETDVLREDHPNHGRR